MRLDLQLFPNLTSAAGITKHEALQHPCDMTVHREQHQRLTTRRAAVKAVGRRSRVASDREIAKGRNFFVGRLIEREGGDLVGMKAISGYPPINVILSLPFSRA
jgi:hypothetical protein